ncbi:MAG: phosphoribosyltransferase [Gaiellaceae bacterium]
MARDYSGRDTGPLMMVAPLKSSVVFLADLSRALSIEHAVDFVELAGYGGSGVGGTQRIRLLKDLEEEVTGRDLLLVEDVVDTGLTLNFLIRTLALRGPASLAVVTLFDRPYRRLVDDLPVRYVGFTIPDELFVGYGFDLDQRYRNLPDIYVVLNGDH